MGVKTLYHKLFYIYSNFICKFFPYSLGPSLAGFEYKRITGQNLNLKTPKNLIEKIIWMQFHSDTSLWTECADKFRVRSYVKRKGLEKILPKLFGQWDKADDIDFDSLPQKFVLKTNNSCGQILIVRDKRNLNIEDVKKKLNQWIKMRYGYHNAQLHYLRIKPCIIAEELLEDKSLSSEENLIDYKIWCFNGIPESIMAIYGRSTKQHYISMYNLNWENISTTALNDRSQTYGNSDIPKPQNLEKMIEYAKILSEGFPEVRVDFYNIEGNIFFGEMTFTAGYGSRSKNYSEYLGSKIDLTKVKRIR